MAPEQANGTRLGVRVDVFAIGALLYYVVVGQAPYQGRPLEALARASQAMWRPVLELAAWVPPTLARIIERAMARDPRDRQASVAQVKDELLRIIRGGDLFEIEEFAAGHVIIREGEPGDVAYIIERGRCAVSMNGERIREMGPGEAFGEMAVLSPGPRTATVTALEPTRVRTISGAALRDEIDAMKPWMASLVRTVADRARDQAASSSSGP
jgi:serine/threonine-protein kinase